MVKRFGFLFALLLLAGAVQASSVIADIDVGTAGGSAAIGQLSGVLVAQSFNNTGPFRVGEVGLWLNTIQDGATGCGGICVSIETDNAGTPSGTVLDQACLDNASITQYAQNNFTFAAPPLLNPNTHYWFVGWAKNNGICAAPADYYSVQMYLNSTVYADGTGDYSTNNRTAWGGLAVPRDFRSMIYGPTTGGLTLNVTDIENDYANLTFNVNITNATNATQYYSQASPASFYTNVTPWGNVDLWVNASGYAPATDSAFYNATQNAMVNFTLLPYGVNITIFDEETSAPLNANIVVANATDSINHQNATNYYYLNTSELTLGSTDVTAWLTGYDNRTFTRDFTTTSLENMNIMLLASNASTEYTVYLRDVAGNAIPYASYEITRTISGTTYLINEGQADSNGLFTIPLQYGKTYSFLLSAPGFATAVTDITASTLNPITIILSTGANTLTWNTSLSSIITNYGGQPLVQGETSLRYANATVWDYDSLEFTGACVEYYWNATVLLNQSCGPTNNASVPYVQVPLTSSQTGLVLQKFTIEANGSNYTYLSWIPVRPSGAGASPEYKSGLVTLISQQLTAGDPDGLGKGGLSFIVLIGSIIVATFIGGATVMSTFIFLILLALFTFIVPIMPWVHFTIIGVAAIAWIYLQGGK